MVPSKAEINAEERTNGGMTERKTGGMEMGLLIGGGDLP
jgi:hypothetical protein